MELQIEAVRQQVLKHDVKVVDVVGAVDPRFYIVVIATEPLRATDDLAHGNAIHQADHEFYGNILGRVSIASGQGFDATAASTGRNTIKHPDWVRIGELDGGYVEGESGWFGLSVSERLGDQAD